jgi:hypothetical protein
MGWNSPFQGMTASVWGTFGITSDAHLRSSKKTRAEKPIFKNDKSVFSDIS